mgnify:CR=1 FL=1
MKTRIDIATTEISIETPTGHRSFEWVDGEVYLNGKPLKTVASPQLRGTDFWTAEKPYVKLCSIINGSFVWWVPSLQEYLNDKKEGVKANADRETV